MARRSGSEASVAEVALQSVAMLRGLLFHWLCGDDPAALNAALEDFLAYMSRRLESSGRRT